MSDDGVPADLRAALAHVPGAVTSDPATWRLTRLAGLSNRNWRVDTPVGAYVVRMPLPDPAGYVTDRAVERAVTAAAATAGLGAPLLASDPAGAFLVSTFVEASRPAMAADGIAVGQALRRLHASDLPIRRTFDPLALIHDYRAALGADAALRDIDWSAVMAAGERFGRTRVPSHGDPVPQNLLVQDGRVTLIDWEYAALTDPAWDLSYFALTAGCSAHEVEGLLAGYGDAAMTHARLADAMVLADAVNRLWAALRARASAAASLDQVWSP